MKKFWALLLCLLLVLQLGISPAKAVGDVYFTAAGSSVLPLKDSTMPFWSGGYLYIPSTMFSDNVWRALDVSAIRTDKEKLILHSQGRPLIFERGKPYAKDANDNRYTPGAVERNGTTFVPAYLVADFFHLQYSTIPVPRGYLVWLRKPGFGLTDRYFADAAYSNMEDAYKQYLKGKEKDKQPVVEPEEELPLPEPELAPAGKKIYLCLEAGENTGALLDELSRRRAGAAFFCTLEVLQEQGDLLRRMVASGQSIGILAKSGHPDYTVSQQLSLGNAALEAATCSRTRLAYIQGGSEEERRSAEDNGFYCLRPNLERGEYSLKSTSNADALMKRISGKRGTVSVWLGESVDSIGLRAFLQTAERTESRCIALSETAK